MFKIDRNVPFPDKRSNAALWKQDLEAIFNALKEGDSFEASIPASFDGTSSAWTCKVRQAMSDWNRRARLRADGREPELVLRSRTQDNGLVRIWKIRNPYLEAVQND